MINFIIQPTYSLAQWQMPATLAPLCLQTFALFWLREKAVPDEILRYSFRVFSCACPTVITSISGKSLHFPFPYFVIFVLRCFPFHMVSFNNLWCMNHTRPVGSLTVTYSSCIQKQLNSMVHKNTHYLIILVIQKYELFLFRTYEEHWLQYGSLCLFTPS